MKLIGTLLRWLGGACYSCATKLDPPAPYVEPSKPSKPSELERAREAIATMRAVRAEVERQLAEEHAPRDACSHLAEVLEQRAAPRRRASDFLTFTRAELRLACNTILAEALERELEQRFRPRLVPHK